MDVPCVARAGCTCRGGGQLQALQGRSARPPLGLTAANGYRNAAYCNLFANENAKHQPQAGPQQPGISMANRFPDRASSHCCRSARPAGSGPMAQGSCYRSRGLGGSAINMYWHGIKIKKWSCASTPAKANLAHLAASNMCWLCVCQTCFRRHFQICFSGTPFSDLLLRYPIFVFASQAP